MSEQYYVIEVHDGNELLFKCEIPTGQIGSRTLASLIKVLAAKHGLSSDEIVDSHLKKNVHAYKPLLEIHRFSGRPYQLTCGTNPHVAVRVIDR